MGSIKLTLGKVTPTDVMAACVAPWLLMGYGTCDVIVKLFHEIYINLRDIYGKESMMQGPHDTEIVNILAKTQVILNDKNWHEK